MTTVLLHRSGAERRPLDIARTRSQSLDLSTVFPGKPGRLRDLPCLCGGAANNFGGIPVISRKQPQFHVSRRRSDRISASQVRRSSPLSSTIVMSRVIGYR